MKLIFIEKKTFRLNKNDRVFRFLILYTLVNIFPIVRISLVMPGISRNQPKSGENFPQSRKCKSFSTLRTFFVFLESLTEMFSELRCKFSMCH